MSPDAGGIKRADRFRARLERVSRRPVAAAFVEKYRSGGQLRGDRLVGEVKGRVAILVDDLVATGGTLARAAEACRREGASRVYAVAAHGLFVGQAAAVLGAGAIDRILVTDTVPARRDADPAWAARVEYLPIAGLFATAIDRLHRGGSISALSEM